MSDISPVASRTAALRGVSVRRNEVPVPSTPSPQPQVRAADSVVLSDHARLLDSLRNEQDVRGDVVARVRGEVQREDYISDEKLDKVVRGLLRDLYA